MLQGILDQQMDYVRFLHGLAWMPLASACLIAGGVLKPELPWRRLGVFGLVLGIGKWLEMPAGSLLGSSTYATVCAAMAIAAWGLLVEFGRAGLNHLRGRGAGRCVLVPLMGAAAAGLLSGSDRLREASSHGLAVIGACWAAAALWRARRSPDVGGWSLGAAAGAMFAYGLINGAVGGRALLFTEGTMHHGGRLLPPAFVAELLLGLSAFIVSLATWRRAHVHKHAARGDGGSAYRATATVPLAAGLTVLLIGGWIATDVIGAQERAKLRNGLLTRAGTLASTLYAEGVQDLSGTAEDRATPTYARVRRVLVAARDAAPDCRRVYLLRVRPDRIIVAVDSGPRPWPGTKPLSPGAAWDEPGLEELRAVVASGRSAVAELMTEGGTWASAYWVVDAAEPVIVMGMDVDVHEWRGRVALVRLMPIGLAGFLGLLLINGLAHQIDHRRAKAELAERIHLAAFASDMTTAAMRAEGVRAMLKECTEVLVNYLDAAFARIWTLNEAENVLELQASSGMYTHIDGPHGRVPVGTLKIGRIAQTRQPHLTNTVLEDPWVSDQEWARREGMVAFAGYPLMAGDRLVGVMAIFSRAPLSSATLSAMGSVADSIAAWIERKRAEQRARDYALALESANRALEEARQAADKANRAKSEFLANMSHELRTPLNGVIGMTELLLGTELTDRQRRFASMARTSGEALLSLINDILDFSKIEAGRMELESTDFRLADVVENVAATFAVKAEVKGVELSASVHPAAPRLVRGDPARLRQILLNLVNNAVKFTSAGEVVIRATVEEEDDRAAVVRFSVSDTGIGIPSDKMHLLFQSFSQLNASTTRQYGGTGLGLAICKQLVELMNGRIGATSREGVGSTFWFALPLEKRGPADAEPHRRLPAPVRAKVLAVDDNATNREILQEQLSALGFETRVADGARQALTLLREAAAAGEPFGMAVLDMNMPDMNGDELGQAIKSEPALKDTILVLVASVLDCDEKRLRAIGFSGWLVKPIWRSVLADAIDNAWTASAGEPIPGAEGEGPRPDAPPDADAAPPAAEVRVLLAEDTLISQELVREILTRAGYRCDVVPTGKQAVTAVMIRRYDLVLMDCQMPEMDGFEATRMIRWQEQMHGLAGRKQGERLPVIALTANAIKGDRERCLEAGMDDYLTKPVDAAVLMSTLRRCLSKARARPPEAPTAPAVDSPAGTPTQSADLVEPSGPPPEQPAPEPACRRGRVEAPLPQQLGDAFPAEG
ncbi:MAG: response regulator, partial [Phycisphaerae bacterium]